MKERDLMNGGYCSVSSRSDSGTGGSSGGVAPKQCEFSVGARDHEPPELSSGSGSDEASDLESQGKDKETLKLENRTQLLQSKKRKFSPIVWDRDEVSNLSKSTVSSATNAFPPPPPLPKSYLKSANSILTCAIHNSPIQDGNLHSSEPLVDIVPHVSAAMEYPAGLSSSPLQEQRGEYNEDLDQLKNEVYAPMRNIRSSRWANDTNFPANEGEFFDAPAERRIQKRRKKIFLATPVEIRVHKKSISSEFGEVKRGGSEGTRGRYSESDEGGTRNRSSSRNGYSDNDLDNKDCMEMGEELNNGGTSLGHIQNLRMNVILMICLNLLPPLKHVLTCSRVVEVLMTLRD